MVVDRRDRATRSPVSQVSQESPGEIRRALVRGLSVDSVAASHVSGVELTKFSPISAGIDKPVDGSDLESGHEVIQFEGQTQSATSGLTLTRSPEVNDHPAATYSMGNNLQRDGNLWSTNASRNQLSNSGSELSINATDKQTSGMATREPFQIVWRNLSFEVDNHYGHMINQSLGKLKKLWPLGKKASKVSEKEAEANCGPRSLDQNSTSKRRTVFENLNGYANSGEITAILGPSGAGKTSLLNAICGRVENYRGQVQLIGGGKRRKHMSVIPQKDHLIESLTVRENLFYSSKILNLDKNFDHEANIMRVIKMLNLTRCYNSVAGSISGGEYKRVSIAQELLRQPDILILDEPTSGLDSLNCKNLIKSLLGLIEASRVGKLHPIAIVMTIHQPGIDIFHMFDHVYCMARGGRVIFDGRPHEVTSVLKDHGGFQDHQMPSGSTNPANILIEIASEDIYGQTTIDSLARFQRKQFELQVGSSDQLSGRVSVSPSSESLAAAEGKVSPDALSSDTRSPSPQDSQQILKTKSMTLCANTQQKNRSGWLSSPSIATSKDAMRLRNGSEMDLVSSDDAYFYSQLQNGNGIGNGTGQDLNRLIRDKRLTPRNDHSGQFWSHFCTLTRRSFVAALRDPFMTMISLVFHLSIPFVMWTVYSHKIGSTHICPALQRKMDIVSLISPSIVKKVEDHYVDTSVAFECSTMFFLTTYAFSMCSLGVSSLAFPLEMHILLKEVKNGWYRWPCYVLAKLVASFPFQVIFPAVSLVMIYLLLGMPKSYMEWRLCAMVLVMALISMISYVHGMVFGALLMNSAQSAIFMSMCTTLPLTLLSGYTARISKMPLILQKLSWFSLYRYSSDAINLIRFGFGICPCDAATEAYLQSTRPSLYGIPEGLRPLMVYYLTNSDSSGTENKGGDELVDGSLQNETIATTIASTEAIKSNLAKMVANRTEELVTGVSSELFLSPEARAETLSQLESNEMDLFSRLADMMSKSFSFGRDINGCESVRSQILIMAETPPDHFLPWLFGGLVGLFVAYEIILFIIVGLRIRVHL